jgi:hypothetical protein
MRDLGVLVDNRLTFAEHVNTIVVKGHLRANQILRCFLSRDLALLTRAFITYVRPILEYCSPVWSPCTASLVNRIESVQRRFTKRLFGYNSLSVAYDTRCAQLGIDRLETRRLRTDLVTCYKIIHGLVAINSDDFFEVVTNRATRGNSYKLVVPDSRIDCRKHFFAVRIVHVWNSLPDEIVSCNNLSGFIRLLKQHCLTQFIIGKP